jgi:NADP-dependent 3-hydroxy acid dehydrogenase YdfG
MAINPQSAPMQEKVFVITGAGRGIGRALALKLGAQGAKMVLASRTYPELQAVAEQVRQAGGQAEPIAVDVTDSRQVNDLIHEAQASYGRIDGLYHGAGIGVLSSALDLKDEELDIMLDTNLKGLFYLARAAIPVMLERKSGHFVVPVGILGRHVMRNSAGYSASKFATVGLLKALGEEFNKRGIRFTALYLGGVNTTFWDTITMAVQRDRMLTADEAAEAALYALASPATAIINEIVMQPDSHQFV